jgi:hypothetical protein
MLADAFAVVRPGVVSPSSALSAAIARGSNGRSFGMLMWILSPSNLTVAELPSTSWTIHLASVICDFPSKEGV